jgi:hypothetical protein
MDVPRFVNRGGKGDEPGDISVTIPYWVYRRIRDMLVAVVLMTPTYPPPHGEGVSLRARSCQTNVQRWPIV